MSEFDKEAERERLREKYEKNQEKRASTQRMSELLLKGATMTNSHCDACGDPIFRHDGQEFCPTCQANAKTAAGGDDGAAADGQDVADAEPAAAEGAETPAATEADPASEPAASERPATEAARRQAPNDPSDPSRVAGTGERARNRVEDGRARDSRSDDRARSADTPIETARASLSRTLVRYTQAAEETDDPRRAKELLAAAREAAETLDALR